MNHSTMDVLICGVTAIYMLLVLESKLMCQGQRLASCILGEGRFILWLQLTIDVEHLL